MPQPCSLADAETILAHAGDGSDQVWVIDQDALRGIVGLAVDFGYGLERGAWGRGNAIRAGRGVLNWNFAQPQAKEVLPSHFFGNWATARALAMLGFGPVGLRTSACLARDQEVHSLLMRLAPDRRASLSVL